MAKRKNHYDTLGVKKDAKPDDIKRAYRRKAREVHPDKSNGNHDAMAELNNAFDVLSDPQRRLLYDSTGEDRQRPIDEEVKSAILQAFHDGLARDVADVLSHAKKLLEAKANQIKAERSKAAEAQKKLSKRRAKIKVNAGENLFHLLIDQELNRIASGIAQCDRGLEVMTAALKLLDEYKSSEKPEAVMQTVWEISSATGSGY